MSDLKQGWRNRGYLPHFDVPGLIQGVTFRLFDAMPDTVLENWEYELASKSGEARSQELRQRINRYEDAGHGCCVLRHDEAALLVENALQHFNGDRYRLFAWVVMPNHVHVLLQPDKEWPLGQIVGSWKKFTARRIRTKFDVCEPLWYREYFDRFIRNEEHFADTLSYIEMNPVKAGLVRSKEEFRWSSAYIRRHL